MTSAALSETLKRLLLNPWLILASASVGVGIGLKLPLLAKTLAPVGDVYMHLLEMCVLPILISAISLNIGRILSASGQGGKVGRLVAMTLSVFVVSALLGMAGGAIGQPGVLNADSRAALGDVVRQSGYAPDVETAIDSPYVAPLQSSGLFSFLDRLVPHNVFAAMASGNNLQVLFFAILFGLALGFASEHHSKIVFDGMDALYRAFSNLIRWFTYLLPFTLPCMVAPQLQQAGMDAVVVMTRFVIVTGGVFLAACLIAGFVLWRRSQGSPGRVYAALKEPLTLAFATGNSLACVPSSLESLESLGFTSRDAGLVLPLGITVFRFGNVMYFAVATLFVAQIYGQPLRPADLAFTLLGSVLAGMATAGTSGVLTLVLLDIILVPLQLPLSGMLPLFVVLEPIMTPLRTILNVLLNCALAALWAERQPSIATAPPLAAKET